MIWVIEGGDGVGKSTLAKALSDRVKAITIHSSFDSSWPILYCHTKIIETAFNLDTMGISVILDRWAPSEEVYGTVFREGPAYDTDKLIEVFRDKITWIFCRNDNAVENHRKNSKSRVEMFDDMTNISAMFDMYVQGSDLPWIEYDFNKTTIKDFLDEILQ